MSASPNPRACGRGAGQAAHVLLLNAIVIFRPGPSQDVGK
jgi:hypothetical protein